MVLFNQSMYSFISCSRVCFLFSKQYSENNSTTLNFVSTNEMNAGIILDELDPGEYYVLLRLKLNNSKYFISNRFSCCYKSN